MRKMMKVVMLGLATCLAAPAMADVSVIVSSGSSASPDKDQVANLFLGKDKSLTAYDLAEWDAAKDGFYADVVSRNESQMKAYWSSLVFTGKGKPLPTVDSQAAMVEKVASDPSAIGYVSSEAVTDSVKVLFTIP